MIYHHSHGTHLVLMCSFSNNRLISCVVDYYRKFPVVCVLHNQIATELMQVFAEIVGEYGFLK